MIEVQINSEPRSLADGLRLDQLVAELDLPAQGVALALNGAVVPRSQWPEIELRAQDQLDIFQSIAGG